MNSKIGDANLSENNELQHDPESILKRMRNNRIVSYLIVLATLLGAVVGFTDTVEKAYARARLLFNSKDSQTTFKTESFWMKLHLNNASVLGPNGREKSAGFLRGDFVRVNPPGMRFEAIEDPLPLLVTGKDGSLRVRVRPHVSDYQYLKTSQLSPGVYEILDVQIIAEPGGRTLSQRGEECPRVIYTDPNGNVIDAKVAPLTPNTWVRIQRTDSILLYLDTDIAAVGRRSICKIDPSGERLVSTKPVP